MAAAKRFTTKQIVAKLREAEKLQGQGPTIPQVCKRLGVSDQTFYRWRLKYGALKEGEAQRLETLAQENARMKWEGRTRVTINALTGPVPAPRSSRSSPRTLTRPGPASGAWTR